MNDYHQQAQGNLHEKKCQKILNVSKNQILLVVIKGIHLSYYFSILSNNDQIKLWKGI